MKNNRFQILLLIIGLTLLLFGSTYLFTRPVFWKSFNFSETGQIGDTIGGITAPIINLIGAILVYLSFQAQINANKIQFKLLNQEIESQKYNNNFQAVLELFKELKNDYKNLNHKEYRGQRALNVFANDIKDHWNKEKFENHCQLPIYFDWKFLMAEYDLIITHLQTAEFRTDEKNKISSLITNYYITQLEYSVNKIKKQLLKFEIDADVLSIISKF